MCSYWQLPIHLCNLFLPLSPQLEPKSHTVLDLTGSFEIMQGIGSPKHFSLFGHLTVALFQTCNWYLLSFDR